jgi:hypothetical protein
MKCTENLFNEIIAENFPSSGEEMESQEHEALKTPNRHDKERISLCLIIIKIPGVQEKERVLKASKKI